MIENFNPQSIHRPANVAELGDLIRRASAEGLALYPFGGGTMQHLGYTPTKPGFGVDMRAFDQVIDYPARDMTITVQAGITIAKLQEVLAKENQRLPIDVPQPEIATLGGAIAVNASGPRRYGYGTLRDYVIGISFMNDEGQEVKAGGRVVKNVAGYDICKLQIGALGTLGIITQVTLKVKPKPEAMGTLWLDNFGPKELTELLDGLHRTQTRPVAVDAVTSRSTRPEPKLAADRFSMCVLFEDSTEAVRWQVSQWKSESKYQWQNLNMSFAARYLAAFTNPLTMGLGFHANMAPSSCSDFLQATVAFSLPPHLVCNAGNGIVYGIWNDELPLPNAANMLTSLRQFTVQNHGNLVITRCPAEWKRELPIWGEPRGDWALMKKVKQAIDPKNLFNPGKFLVG